jgi:hypothetical protein
MDRADERLALIEIFERDGRAARAVDVRRWPLTIGRALDNAVVLDDPYAAAHHAQLDVDAQGRVVLQVLECRNGVAHAGRRVGAGESLVLPEGGATLLVGTTRLRLRLAAEVLAPEKPLPGPVRGHWVPLLGCAMALLGLQAAVHWLQLDPGADYSSWLSLAVGLPVAVAAWCGLWALMSKLFQHRFDFAGHLRIALPGLLAIGATEALWPQLSASVGAAWLWQLSAPLQGLLGALLVRAHLGHVLPSHQRAVSVVVATLALAGGAISLALTQRSSDSFTSAPYMSTLPLPALRWAGTVPTAALVQEMAPLAGMLAQRVKKAREDDEEEGDAAAE